MKIIILFFGFVLISSCVTANTKKRNLSGINENPAQGRTPDDDDNLLATKWRQMWDRIFNKEKETDSDQIDQDKPLSKCEKHCADVYSYEYRSCMCACQAGNDCISECICDGGSSLECHRGCEE